MVPHELLGGRTSTGVLCQSVSISSIKALFIFQGNDGIEVLRMKGLVTEDAASTAAVEKELQELAHEEDIKDLARTERKKKSAKKTKKAVKAIGGLQGKDEDVTMEEVNPQPNESEKDDVKGCDQHTRSKVLQLSAPENPVLRGLEKRQIAAFVGEMSTYVERCAASGTIPLHMKYCIKNTLLDTLYQGGAFGHQYKSLPEVPPERIEEYLKSIPCQETTELDLDEIRKFVNQHVKIAEAESNCHFRIVVLIGRFKSVLMQQGWGRLLDPDVARIHGKTLVKLLLGRIDPPHVRARLSKDIKFAHRVCASDFEMFCKFVLQKYELYSTLVVDRPNKRGRFEASDSSDESEAPPKKTKKVKKPKKKGQGASHDEHKKEWNLFCLNKRACKGKKHRMSECPNTTPEEAKELLRKYRKFNFFKLRNKMINVSHIQSEKTNRSSAFAIFSASGNTKLTEIQILADTGANICLAPRRIAEELSAKIVELPEPIRLKAGINNGNKNSYVLATHVARLNISILAHSNNGNTQLRYDGLPFVLIDYPDTLAQVIVGENLMTHLGIEKGHIWQVMQEAGGAHVDCNSMEAYPAEDNSDMEHRINALRFQIGSDEPDHVLKEKLVQLDKNSKKTEPIETTYKTGPSLFLNNINAALSKDKTDFEKSEYEVEEDMGPYLSIGQDTPQEIDIAIDNMLREAEDNGISAKGRKSLRKMLYKKRNIWRIKLGDDPPAKIPPMKIKLKQGTIPIASPVRRYSPERRAFISKFVNALEKVGAVKPNINCAWMSCPHAVPKPGTEQFRFCLDMRRINDASEPIVWPMPHVDTVLSDLTHSTVYSKLDFSHGYWQIALDKDSQDCQSFGTDEGIWTPTRVLQGSKNSSAYFQGATSKIFSPIRTSLLQWLDDWLIHAKTETKLLHVLSKFFSLCEDHNIKLNANKCSLFTKEVTWCGRKISADGIEFDPRRLSGLKEMNTPTNGAELQQFITSINWMRQAIPNYNHITAPLYDILEEVYQHSGKRTKRAAKKVKLKDTSWNQKHEECFRQVQQSLREAVKLAIYDPKQRLCLFTDASDSHWASVLTQVPNEDLEKPFEEQRHSPLAFLSGNFKGSSANWSVPEKEGYSIVASMTKLDYLTMCQNGVSIFTDHRNLLYIFNPLGQDASVSKHIVSKLSRWAMKLSAFTYSIHHIPGENNVWADMLTRWTKNNVYTVHNLYYAPLHTAMKEPISWPDGKEILASQEKYRNEAERLKLETDDIGLNRYQSTNAIWIPSKDNLLQFRLMVIAHCGIGGHRAASATLSKLHRRYEWEGMKSDVEEFQSSCFHCLATIGARRVPRPMGHQIHSDSPNEVIHFDYLYIGEARESYQYILIIKDDFSGYVWLLPCKHADAWTTAQHLTTWFASFGVSAQWVSDRGSHFKNTLIDKIRQNLRVHHHFTTAYTPFANGTVERVCRETLRVLRALLSEYRMPIAQWPDVVPVIQSAINNAPVRRLSKKTPNEAFLGRTAQPLDNIIQSVPKKATSVGSIHQQQQKALTDLTQAITELHREVKGKPSKQRQTAVDRHNAKTHVIQPNFTEGDFVLVADTDKHMTSKVLLKWRGPRRITKVLSDFVYEVENLIDKRCTEIHATRLKFYRDSSHNEVSEMMDMAEFNDTEFYTVQKIIGLKRLNGTLVVKVLWRGFPAEEATWEPVEVMYNDVPKLMTTFLENFPNQTLSTEALRHIRATQSEED